MFNLLYSDNMYNLNTSSPRTDLYKQGSGEAQEFDNKDFMQRENRQFQLEGAQKLQKQKQAADRQDDLLKMVAKAGSAQVKPADLPYFQKEQQALYDQAVKSFDANGNISTQAYVELIAKVNKIATESEMSKNQREALEQVFRTYDPLKQYSEEYEQAKELYGTKQGNWGQVPALKEKVDLNDYVRKELFPIAKEKVSTGQRGPVRFTAEDADKLLEETYLSNPSLANDVNRQSGKATPEESLQWFKDNQRGKLVTEQFMYAPQAPYTGVGSQAYKSKINAVYNPETGELSTRTGITGEKAIESDVVIGDKSVRIEPPYVKFDPETKEIEGGSYTIVPTEDEKATNSINAAINKEKEKDLEKALRRNPKPVAGSFESQKAYNSRYLEWAQKNEVLKKEYAPLPIVKSRTVKTDDPDLIRRLYFETWAKYPEDVAKGEGGEGVNFMNTQAKKKESAEETKTLPSGLRVKKVNGVWTPM